MRITELNFRENVHPRFAKRQKLHDLVEFVADSRRRVFGGQCSTVKISRGVLIVDSELRSRERLLVFLEGWQ